MKTLIPILFSMLVLAGCGGGGGSSNRAPQQEPVAAESGSLTVVIGDNALDGISAVIIDIEDVLLLGDDDAGQISLIDEPINDVNLLDLQYVTTLIADTDVPAGEYSKIRLRISSLEVVEDDDTVVDVQLPANGKIDLNPQGEFEIGPGEDLVVQIDIDLARSIKIVQTGNSKYRFRPVVFIDVLNDGDDFRLSVLTGTLQNDDDDVADATGEVSDYDLCTEVNPDPCVDLLLAEGATLWNADESAGDFELLELTEMGEAATVFGRWEVSAEGRFFRVLSIVLGGEPDLTTIDGDVTAAVVDEAFELTQDDDTVNSVIITDALLLDGLGNPLTVDIMVGQEAEAWAFTSRLDDPEVGDFPAFLVQVRDDDDDEDEEVAEGMLVGILDDTLTLSDEGVEICVTVDEDTEYRLLSDYNGDAASDEISLVALGDLFEGGSDIEIEVFGELVGECYEADVIAAEVD